MKFKNQVICTGIKASEGEMEGRKSSSTTFHLIVDVADNSWGESIGQVSRPFKLGDASEFGKWKHLKNSWPAGGLVCDCEFDVVAAADNKSQLTLVSIKPAAQAKA